MEHLRVQTGNTKSTSSPAPAKPAAKAEDKKKTEPARPKDVSKAKKDEPSSSSSSSSSSVKKATKAEKKVVDGDKKRKKSESSSHDTSESDSSSSDAKKKKSKPGAAEEKKKAQNGNTVRKLLLSVFLASFLNLFFYKSSDTETALTEAAFVTLVRKAIQSVRLLLHFSSV